MSGALFRGENENLSLNADVLHKTLVVVLLTTSKKCTKTKTARAERARLLSFANL